jgi:hypothetical protein
MVETRITNTNSPWLTGVQVGDIHTIPVSHGEGKFVVSETELAELIDNGQIITQYVDFQGKPSMDSFYNPNGSVAAIEGIISKMDRFSAKWVILSVMNQASSKISLVIKTNNSLRVPWLILEANNCKQQKVL